MARVTVPIVHFNDVYRVRQTVAGGEHIGAEQFAAKVAAIRSSWGENTEPRPPPIAPFSWDVHRARPRKGLVLFSGDLFNPSVESSITRGTHMVPVVNAMNVDVAVLGNHEWDFGYPHLQTLLSKTRFPWLFSNVVDASWREGAPDPTPEPQPNDVPIHATIPYFCMHVNGVKIGCVGLVEEEWLDTVPAFPPEFEYRDMIKVALQLSKQLREGPEQCELIIALTHCRMPNDVELANKLGAVSNPDPNQHGVDIILGGHDHVYYVGRGIGTYDGAEYDTQMEGTEADARALLLKSGTDFHDLSEIELHLSAPHDAIRRRTIESVSVRRHQTKPSDPAHEGLAKRLEELLAHIRKSTSQPVAYSLTPWDVRASSVRTDESALGDFIADILLHSMGEMARAHAAHNVEGDHVDCCIICGGALRGDAIFGPGRITLGNVLEVLPFEDSVVLVELTGQDIWDALENGLSSYPRQEGRFPQISGLSVVWDSSRPPGSRVISVDFMDVSNAHVASKSYKFRQSDGENESVLVLRQEPHVKAPLRRDKKYRVATRAIDDESGQLMSTLVRKFLLGANYIWRCKDLRIAREDEAKDAAAPQNALQTPDVSFEHPAPSTPAKSPLTRLARVGEQYLSPRTAVALKRARALWEQNAHQ
ncbi:hypothetical protein MCUN1_001657 [Malassezia cuniculi]|uniref:5'-nucleotidase n=1 Tax=Malassezia cuniculi TaxID=948313 RepID=A0AAF0J624_9BASI|nr:hypothetical protein MCUN1_001657 [Malassezia cuniculi]